MPEEVSMKFAYTIMYVDDVDATVAFYERAFGFARKTLVPGEYGELDTGGTKLSFAVTRHVKEMLGIPVEFAGPARSAPPVEVGFVVADVGAAFEKALSAGAVAVLKPTSKPWGQIVSYVRDNNGFLVELCTAME